MGIEGAGEQGCLKEKKCGGPDGWRAAQKRENQFAEHGLYPEEQGGGREDCGSYNRKDHLHQAAEMTVPQSL
jgi:hypothetical protein